MPEQRAGPRASKAMAQRLAIMVGDPDRFIRFGGYMTPTDNAILSRGWAKTNGEVGFNNNGTVFQKCVVTPDGMRALASYLMRVANDSN